MAEQNLKISPLDLLDEDLVLLAQKGDVVALDTIIARYKAFVCMKVKDYFIAGADRDDIIQEGMIGLYKAVCDYRDDKYSSFKTFAGICIVRHIITAIKSATRQKHMPLNSYISLNRQMYDGDTDETLMDVMAEKYPQNPETIMIDKEDIDGIETKISKVLSSLELQVLVYYLEGRTYHEISVLIKKDVKSVDNAVQRIKKKLEAILMNKN